MVTLHVAMYCQLAIGSGAIVCYAAEEIDVRAETNIRLVRIFARLHKYSNT